jgi:hypothetical protein
MALVPVNCTVDVSEVGKVYGAQRANAEYERSNPPNDSRKVAVIVAGNNIPVESGLIYTSLCS